MRRVRSAVGGLIVAIGLAALTACAATAPPTPTGPPPPATARPANGSTLAPAPAPTATPVDPADYLTLLPSLTERTTADINGVDFDTADRSITCSIFDPFSTETGSFSPWTGCYPQKKDFIFPPAESGGDPASAVSVIGDAPGNLFILSDLIFPEAYPASSEKVKVLSPGTSITWSTVTCVAIDDGIQCTSSATSHGFFLSKVKYRLY